MIYISGNSKPLWERKRKEQKENHLSSAAVTSPPEGSTTPLSQVSTPSETNNKMYLLTPRTRILTLTKEHHMVFMIDLSSSLATIETGEGNLMMGNAYQVLENTILGLIQPFSLNTSDVLPPFVMEHTINITVIAEYSQFGSNINVIPILAEYPTMRVLLQNVHVTTSNSASVLKVLHTSINKFQMDLGNFRKKLTLKRSKLGYELDVRSDHSQAVEDTNSNYNIPTMDQTKCRSRSDIKVPQLKKSDKKSEIRQNRRSSSSSGVLSLSSPVPALTTASNMSKSTKDTHRKDVWGVGKTGSNLSYILRAGLFALNLVPKQGKRSLIFITDGVVKSNISDETIIRQLTTENITCSMIQVGQAHGFFPGLNFGFIPDNEILRFVATATHGHFMFAEECTPVQACPLMTPNYYHHKLLLHEIYFDKAQTPRSIASRKKEDTEIILDEEDAQRVFPWDPLSTPINEDMGLLKYKEYLLPTECWHFMRARLRQGFTLNSVSLFDESNKSSSPIKNNNNGRKEESQKRERVMIVFILRWQPQMTVEYRIKSMWTSSLRRYLKSIHNHDKLIHIPEDPETDKENDVSLFSCMRAPKAEILVRTTTSFSHMLHNWEAFQRRSQIMLVQGAKNSIDISSTPGFIKVGKIKRILERLAESDNMLKQLVQFNHETETQHNYTAKFNSLWSKLDRSDLRTFNMCWYDEVSISLIINHTDSLVDSIRFYMDDSIDYDETELALYQLYSNLEEWASYMSEDRQTCIKILTGLESQATNITENYTTRKVIPQFCEVRVVQETERLVCIRFLFFNTTAHLRQLTVDSVKDILHCDQTPSTEDASSEQLYSNLITKRPLSSLLLRDATHFTSRNNDVESKTSKLWYINPAYLLTGEFIVRNILQQHTWHWDIQDIHSQLKTHNKPLASLIDLAFECIAFARTRQKWSVLCFNKTFGHFYKEISTENDSVFSIQYFIWKDYKKKKITTETWVEPLSNESTFKLQEVIQNEYFEKDKNIFMHLVTFDALYALGKQILSSISDLSKDRLEMDDNFKEVTKWMQQFSLFNIPSVLSQGSLLLASYTCPNYNRHYHPKETGDLSASAALAAASSNQSHIQNISLLEQDSIKANRRNLVNPRSRTASRFSPISSPLVNAISPLMWHNDKNNSCVCPRPDELFCNEKDTISKLRPVLRDIALLHYYVEQSLSTVTDQNLSLNRTTSDDFWSNLVRDIVEANELDVGQSTLFVAPNFRDLKCFIKTFDSSTFVLILIPRLDAIIKGLNHLESKGGNQLFDKISLTMFECHRQVSSNSMMAPGEIKIRPINSLSSKEWIESLGSTLRPSMLRGYIPNLPDDPLSDRTLLLMQNITQVYTRSFVKSVFTCLLHGRAIDSDDFENVLEICDESNLDIDLTGYLNVQTLLNKRSGTSEEELLSINQRFVSVLGHYFEPVIISNSERTNIYCYRPPFAKVGQKLGLSLSSGEKPTNLADVVVCAQNPLFIRLECTFQRPSSTGFTEITFPLNTLPSLYVGETEDGSPYNFEPQSIGTDYSSIASSDGTTATLHIVCMTLPQSDHDPPNALFSHLSQCPADNTPHHQASFLDVDKTHRARLPSLSQDKQDALVETEARLTWLFTEEIMHGLLRSGPITQNVIRYIEAQLKKKNPFVDFPTTMFIPLAFVKNRKDSRRMFFELLENHKNTPYQLVRVGDCFYASDNGQIQPGNSMYDGLNIKVSEEENNFAKKRTEDMKKKKEDENNNEYCQGLGISILDPNDEVKTAHPQLYWLLLIPQAQSVQIYFYSKMQQSVNRSEIIRLTKSMVNEVMDLTNKKTLLQSLHDSRICRQVKYLIAPMDGEKQIYSSEEDTSDDDEYMTSDNLVDILSTSGEESNFSPPRKFLPGQFRCDVKHTARFSLHWRLQPNAALSKLMTDTLLPFLVKNKPGMFVISDEHSVVYCFLSEVNSMIPESFYDSYSFTAADDSNYQSDSPYGNPFMNTENTILSTSQRSRHPSHIYGKTSPPGSMISERLSPKNSPSLTDIGTSASSPATGKKFSGQSEVRQLLLEVYGVERNYYIFGGLVEMVESGITSGITLKEVQQFLVRNPTSKLSRADVDFILPIEKSPLLHKRLCIPPIIKGIAQFLKILRKNILSSPALHAIYSNYLSGTIKQLHRAKYRAQSTTEPKGDEEWSCLNLLFYYNYLNRAPGTYLPFEQRVGEGVAGVCLTIRRDGQALFMIPDLSQKRHNLDSAHLKNCFEFEFEFDYIPLDEAKQMDQYHGYEIVVAIWSHCKLEVSHIYDLIYKSFKQSICDYLIETIVSNMPARKIKLEDEFNMMANLTETVLEQAALWDSPSVKKCFRSINLTPWYFDGLVSQFKSDLQDIHPSFDPVIARTRTTCNLDNTKGNDKPNYKLHNPFELYDNLLENSMLEEDDRSYPPRKNSGFAEKNEKSSRKKKRQEMPMFDHKNYKYLVLSGLPELYNRYSAPPSRRFSIETTDMSQRSRVMTSIDDELHMFTRKDQLRKEDSASIHSRQESLASSVSKPLTSYIKHKTNDFKDNPHLHSFIVMTLGISELTMYSYNYSDSFSDYLFNTMYKNVSLQENRHIGLYNILHQKMGLFYHTEGMSKILSNSNNTFNSPPTISSSTTSTIGVPFQHSTLAQIQSSASSARSPSLSNTIGRLAHTDSTSSIQSIESNEQHVTVNFENLKQLVTNTFEFNIHYKQQQLLANSATSIFDTIDNAKLSKTVTSKSTNGSTVDVLYSAARTANANTVLKDTYARSTEFNKLSSSDYLLRHGEPYLQVYLSRSKPLEAHEKAFKVYTKWAERYYGPGHTKTIDEMMTVAELQEILKASRLLHFCRTPVIFSESFSIDTLTKTEEVTGWYERLARGFMKEYASYLESIGMHLIVYGPSNDQKDEQEAYISKLSITENYSVDSPVVYLLQVFEGGSIMCEARLTRSFISVTLYTLHRRYGRLQFSPYSHQSREVGRENFQKFMSECDQFKQRIHVNSFVFDFNLRHIQRSLDDIDSLPPNLDLLGMIEKTASVYDRPAIYSRNRIIQSTYDIPKDDTLKELVPWILSSGSKLGLKTLSKNNEPVACFISADSLSFDPDPLLENLEDTHFRYTLLICPQIDKNDIDYKKWRDNVSMHQQGSFDMNGPSLTEIITGSMTDGSKFSLRYFILVTYRGMDRCTNSERCQRAWSEVLNVKPKRYHNLLDEILEPESITLKDVFDAAKVKMSNIVNKAIYFYRRENDWEKLCHITYSNDFQEHIKLTTRFGPIDLCDADPVFAKLLILRGLDWNQLMNYLKHFYPLSIGEVNTADSRQMLLFFCENIFFNLVNKMESGLFSISISCKEDREIPGIPSDQEQVAISQLATIVSFYVWKHIK